MDIMFTAHKRDIDSDDEIDIYINYGDSNNITCTTEPVITKMMGEPLALDYNNDMIIDLFGVRKDKDGEIKRSFWMFQNKRGTAPKIIDLSEVDRTHHNKLTYPHSHAVLDLDDDALADLCLSTENGFEKWLAKIDGDGKTKFHYNNSMDYPTGKELGNVEHYGQAVYLDMELNGNLFQLLPICHDHDCKSSQIWVHSFEHYKDLNINFVDDNKTTWGFVTPKKNGLFYEKAVTLRVGDFNNDGYPDLLATLERKDVGVKTMQTVLLENVPNSNAHDAGIFKRTFVIRWNALAPLGQNTIMGSFYDFYQDGILDVIMLKKNGNQYKPLAFRNTLDYDANFVKVIVLTGLENSKRPPKETHPFGTKSRSYGTNLPGPKIKYKTTTQEGQIQRGASTQLPQSAYFSLHLPYQIFGLGRTPNFVDYVVIGLAGKTKEWPQIIPNSQMLVIPKNPLQPWTWKAQLFVTPSNIIIQSVIALLGE